MPRRRQTPGNIQILQSVTGGLAPVVRYGEDQVGRTKRLPAVQGEEFVQADGELEYVIIPADQSGDGKDIVISQGDINNILRAKGAIFAAAAVLLNALNMKFSDLARVMVAGGFGNFLNIRKHSIFLDQNCNAISQMDDMACNWNFLAI